MGARRSGDSETRGEAFPRALRIRRGSEIRWLLRRGERRRATHIEIFTAPTEGPCPRFGTIVPRYGRSVVERNRLRRRLREIGRRDVLPRLREVRCPLDVLVRVRFRGYEAGFPELRNELLNLTDELCSDASSSV